MGRIAGIQKCVVKTCCRKVAAVLLQKKKTRQSKQAQTADLNILLVHIGKKESSHGGNGYLSEIKLT